MGPEQDFVYEPHRWVVQDRPDGQLVTFMVENQDLFKWAFLAGTDDPPVWIFNYVDDSEEMVASRFSDFVLSRAVLTWALPWMCDTSGRALLEVVDPEFDLENERNRLRSDPRLEEVLDPSPTFLRSESLSFADHERLIRLSAGFGGQFLVDRHFPGALQRLQPDVASWSLMGARADAVIQTAERLWSKKRRQSMRVHAATPLSRKLGIPVGLERVR